MRCTACGAGWPEGTKFCGQCGAALPRGCSACGHPNPAEANFCLECGKSLTDSASLEKAQVIAPRRSSAPLTTGSLAERRHLTILFCDMVGSSALSTQLDPEEQRDLVSTFQSVCANEVKRFEGMVAQYLGDGVLAYFGYPSAHEDDAERAVRAALGVIDAVKKTGLGGKDLKLQARIGIASGIVVVGDLVRDGITQENAAIGATTNLAARLQSVAEPNTIVISPETFRLVGALFEYRDIGTVAVKGFADRIQAYQVLRASTVESRFEARHPAITTPLLGREEELELLLRRWDQATRGEGRIVLLTGEPGIGKSRLTRALQEKLSKEAHISLTYFCSPYHQDSALHPVIRQLQRAAAFERDDSPQDKIDKLRTLLARSSVDLPEHLSLFAALLSIPPDERCPAPNLAPRQLKDRTLAALLTHLKHLAASQPGLMIFEDAHWIDPTSSELLSLTSDLIRDQRILLLVTARPEFTSPWPSHRHISTMALSRLGKTEGEALIEGVTGGRQLPYEVLRQIVERTDGVPLFIEELTKTVIESGLLRDTGDRYELTGPLPPLAIPSTLHASLLARLDRLAEVKNVAQIGATIGREFAYSLLDAAAALPTNELNAALIQLVEAGLIFQRGVPPEATYQFKHALVQDAAYASLVRSRRQKLHAHIAEAMLQQFPDTAKAEPETLAHHFDEAGLHQRAFDYWKDAGKLAESRSAIREAARHYKAALHSYSQLTNGDSRLELELNLKLGNVISQVDGYTSDELRKCYLRSIAVAEDIGDMEAYARVCCSMAPGTFFANGQFSEPLRVLDRINVDKLGTASKIHYHIIAAVPRFHLGQPAESLKCVEQAIALDNAAPSTHAHPIGGADPAIVARAYAVWATILLGDLAQEAKIAKDALEIAEQRGHKPTIVWARQFPCRSDIYRRNFDSLARNAKLLVQLSEEFGFHHRAALGSLYLGYARLMNSEGREGLDDVRRGHQMWQRFGGKFHASLHAAETSVVLMDVGLFDAAIEFLELGEQVQLETEERFCKSELLRIRARITEAKSPSSSVERLYREAGNIAANQGAKLFQLRTAIDLGRLLYTERRADEATTLLLWVLSEVPEDSGLPELGVAKRLMEEFCSYSTHSSP